MAAPRLPFLWPMLAKGVETSINPSVRSVRASARFRAFHSTPQRRRPDPVPQQQRYGTANQPPPHLSGGKKEEVSKGQDAPEPEKALPRIGEKLQSVGEAEVRAEQEKAGSGVDKKEPTTVDGSLSSNIQADPILDAGDSRLPERPPGALETLPEKPLESLLQTVPDPQEHAEEQQSSSLNPQPDEGHPSMSYDEHSPPVKAPHIDTPRYVHHFDTYGLVRRLVDSGWSEAQAITSMKGVRLMLSKNMDLAREALVSKSQVENETYLFRAACAELKTEITSRRKGEQEKMRTERNQLQHEVEILSQRLGQESAALKDELKGMFDDRKMAVRNEQRIMESKVQRLNYQITVDLQADAKSEVEGLRWIMTRRVIIALGVVVIMVVASLRIFSNAAHEQEMNAKRQANMKSGATQTDARSNKNESQGGDGREGGGPVLGGGEMLVDSLSTG